MMCDVCEMVMMMVCVDDVIEMLDFVDGVDLLCVVFDVCDCELCVFLTRKYVSEVFDVFLRCVWMKSVDVCV